MTGLAGGFLCPALVVKPLRPQIRAVQKKAEARGEALKEGFREIRCSVESRHAGVDGGSG